MLAYGAGVSTPAALIGPTLLCKYGPYAVPNESSVFHSIPVRTQPADCVALAVRDMRHYTCWINPKST